MSSVTAQAPSISPDTWHFRVFRWYMRTFNPGQRPAQIGRCGYWFTVLFEAPLFGFVTYTCGAFVAILAALILGWVGYHVVSANPTKALIALLAGIAGTLFAFLWLYAQAKGWAVERWTTNSAYAIARRVTTMKQRICPIMVLPTDY